MGHVLVLHIFEKNPKSRSGTEHVLVLHINIFVNTYWNNNFQFLNK